MAVTLQGDSFPLSLDQVEQLWQATIRLQGATDVAVAVKSVSKEEIQALNLTYRGHDKPTNVLTFSYQSEGAFDDDTEGHDVALCLEVAEEEARIHQVLLGNYTALLLVHAFLHVIGMDHETSQEEDEVTRHAEEEILKTCGFPPLSLADLY